MKKCVLVFVLIGLINLVVSAQDQGSSILPELMSCEKSASMSDDLARFNEKPSDSILMEAVKELQVSEPAPDTVYETYDVQKMPSFPGGEAELQKFIIDNLSIPKPNRETNICGTAAIRFVVSANGELTDFFKLTDCFWTEQLVKVIQSGPRWIPGERNGVPVPVNFTIPLRIHFE